MDETAKVVQAFATAAAALVAALSIPVALYQVSRNRFLQMELMLISLLQDYVKGRTLPELGDVDQATHDLWKWSASNLLVSAALERFVKSLSWRELGLDKRTRAYIDQVFMLLKEDREHLKRRNDRLIDILSKADVSHAHS